MESQLKEEIKDETLCFESSSEDLASLSIVERYDRFLKRSDVDSDANSDDFFPDDDMIRQEYAQLRNDVAIYPRIRNHRLSTGLPGLSSKLSLETTISVTDDDTPNGSAKPADDRTGTSLIELEELIKNLKEVRKNDPEEGNSIFCTEEELQSIQERYGQILDLISVLKDTFDNASQNKDLDSQQTDSVIEDHNNIITPQNKFVTQKMESVKEARDRFYEVEQQVRDQIEQLELVERYKMESVS